MLTDMLDRDIEVGDIVLYTEPGAGRKLPGLRFGEVAALTKAGVTVYELNNDFSRVQSMGGYYRKTGVTTQYSWGLWEETEFVKTGMADKPPTNVRFYENRFYIVKKI